MTLNSPKTPLNQGVLIIKVNIITGNIYQIFKAALITNPKKGYRSLDVRLDEQFTLISALKQSHSILTICNAFKVHRSSYKYGLKRKEHIVTNDSAKHARNLILIRQSIDKEAKSTKFLSSEANCINRVLPETCEVIAFAALAEPYNQTLFKDFLIRDLSNFSR